jgi:ATP phosphoribosyltransferase regulatory subunit
MSGGSRWLLPEGIEEVLPPEAARLENLRRRLIDLYGTWGYDLVMPPFIEFLDSLLTGTGHDLDLQTFKLTDQLTGRMMGLRADMTPQVARIDAHHLHRDVPVRLCYLGTVLHTRPDGFARSRSPLQVGAELYGHPGIEADAEVLCLMLETLAVIGVRAIHVDLGHVGVFRGLARQAGLTGGQEQTLYEALQRKAGPEIEAYLDRLGLAPGLRDMLAVLVDLNGGEEVLEQARHRLGPAEDPVHAAIDNLEQMALTAAAHAAGVPLYFDLAELRGYNYHTGVVFAAFVPGHGQEIARGGRYDAIGEVFGRARPATGFSTDLKTLMSLGASGEGDGSRAGILAPWSGEAGLVERVRQLRAAGERVVYALPGQSGTSADMGCDSTLIKKGDAWEVGAPSLNSE